MGIYNWDANTKAVYLFENNGLDDTANGFNMVNGNGTQLYSNTIVKSGTYSYLKQDTSQVNWQYTPDGLSDYFYNGGNPKPFTIEFYMYAPTNTVNQYIAPFFRGNQMNANGMMDLECYPSGNNCVFYQKSVATSQSQLSFGVLKTDLADKWINYALTYDGTTLKMYFEGTMKASRLDNNPFAYNTAKKFAVGWYDSSFTVYPFYVDNLIFSDIARTTFPTLPLPSPTNSGGVYTKGMAFNRMLRNNFGGVK